MKRQNHGFVFEDYIINKYNLKKSTNYTSKFDAYTDTGIPVQIKCAQYKKSICLGDFKRNQNVLQDFILIIGVWKKDRYKIEEEHSLYIDSEKYRSQCSFEFSKEMFQEITKISNKKTDDCLWKSFIKKYKNVYPKSNIVRLAFKRDHKKQKRIQCTVSLKNLEFKDIKVDFENCEESNLIEIRPNKFFMQYVKLKE